MKLEIQTRSTETQDIPVRFTKCGKAVLGLLGAGLAVGGIAASVESNTPDFHGEHAVTISKDTVTGIAKDHVRGAENATQATVRKIVEMNPDVFQDGKAFVESEDVGKTIDVPDSVDN